MPPSAPLPPHESLNISAALPNLSPRPSPGSLRFIPPPAVNTICSGKRSNKFKFYFLPSAWLSSDGASASWAVPSARVWKLAGLFFKMSWNLAISGFLTPSLHGWGEGCFLDSLISYCPIPGKQLQPGRILNQSSTTTAALHSLSILTSRSSVLFQSHLATHIMSTVPGILCLFSLLGLLVPLGGALAPIRFTDILVFFVVSKCVVFAPSFIVYQNQHSDRRPECLNSFSNNMCV